VAAVVVDHNAADVLTGCLRTLSDEPVDPVVVVDNGSDIGSLAVVDPASVGLDGRLQLVRTGANLGYGAGANRGVAVVDAALVLVANPDIEVHRGAVAALAEAVLGDPTVAIAGPTILDENGQRYPSSRRFPSAVDAAGHALLGRWWPQNPFSRRYRMDDVSLGPEPTVVDWVSGACLLVRRQAWEELGGFDEGYFMYAEDMDLCWRAGRAGWRVVHQPAAVVTHHQGVSTRQRPFAMAVAHHRSALRFARRRAEGWRMVLLPAAVAVLGTRLLLETARLVAAAVGHRRRG